MKRSLYVWGAVLALFVLNTAYLSGADTKWLKKIGVTAAKDALALQE